MKCENCRLFQLPSQIDRKPVCDGKAVKPGSQAAFNNAVIHNGLHAICRCSPFREYPYEGKP